MLTVSTFCGISVCLLFLDFLLVRDDEVEEEELVVDDDDVDDEEFDLEVLVEFEELWLFELSEL